MPRHRKELDAEVHRPTTFPGAEHAALSRRILAMFTLPSLMLGVMHGPEGQMQAIYAKHAGVALTALAAASLLSKILDAITYPLIGHLSDHTYARRGTRKGWVVAGMIISVLGMWQLLRPGTGVGVFYFGVWLTVTYVGWKLMEIPLQAWSYGLSADYAQRTRVQSWRGLAQVCGTLLFFVVPFLAVKIGYSDSSELDFRSLGLSAVICAVGLPLVTLIAVAKVPDGAGPPPAMPKRVGLSEVFQAVAKNPPLFSLLAVYLPVTLLSGLMNGVLYLYVDTYLGLAKQLPAVMVLAILASIVGIPFWSALAKRFERHHILAVILVGCAIGCAGFAQMSPGPFALPLAYVIYPVITFCVAGTIVVYAMSADIVDYGRLVTGEDHAGLYGSIFAFVQKSLLGVSAAAGLAIVGLCGFDATATSQTPGAIVGLKMVVAVVPALGMLCAAAVAWRYPLTRARISEIQAQLQRRG